MAWHFPMFNANIIMGWHKIHLSVLRKATINRSSDYRDDKQLSKCARITKKMYCTVNGNSWCPVAVVLLDVDHFIFSIRATPSRPWFRCHFACSRLYWISCVFVYIRLSSDHSLHYAISHLFIFIPGWEKACKWKETVSRHLCSCQD